MFVMTIEGLEKRTLFSAHVVSTFQFQPPYLPSYESDVTATPERNRIAVATMPRPDGNNDVAVARYKSDYDDAAIDGTFGKNGVSIIDVAGAADQGAAIALQPDGGIVIAGNAVRGGKTVGFIARLLSGGGLDSTFGTGGIATLSLDAKSTRFSDVALWGGKMVVSGTAGSDVITVRFNSDGSLDSSFNIDGVVVHDLGAADQGGGLAVTADGRIAVAAFTTTSDGGNAMALLRYRASGALDNRFSGDGVWTTRYGAYARANAVHVDGRGRIMVAGMVSNSKGNFPAVARLSGSGKMDKNFGRKGWMVSSQFHAEFFCLTVLADGTYAAGGGMLPTKVRAGVLAKISGDGMEVSDRTPDSGNSLKGKPIRGIAPISSERWTNVRMTYSRPWQTLQSAGTAGARVVQPDGKTVLLVSARGSFQLCRVNPDGTLDKSFGDSGWSDRYVTPYELYAPSERGGVALRLRSDGSFIAMGTRSQERSPSRGIVLAKYMANGRFDKSFGTAGIREIPSITDDESANQLEVEPSGRILASATEWYNGNDVYRLNADGSDGPGFGKYFDEISKQRPDGDNSSRHDTHFGVADNGDIVVSGTIGRTNPVIYTARMHSDTSLVTSFGTNGIHFTSLDQDARLTPASDPLGLVQGDGSFLYAARAETADYQTLSIVRHDQDGQLDQSFGANGRISLKVGLYPSVVATRVLPDGDIVVMGTVVDSTDYSGSTYSAFVFRLNRNGTLDPSFGDAGQPITYIRNVVKYDSPPLAIIGDSLRTVIRMASGELRVVDFDL